VRSPSRRGAGAESQSPRGPHDHSRAPPHAPFT